MARDENPPFDRGQTFYNGATIDSANLGGAQWEGKEWVFEDTDPTAAGAKTARTNRYVKCRCVRNKSGIALLPKRLARFKASAGVYGAQIDGYTTATAADWAGVIDEWLPAAGVPDNDLCWITVSGPSQCLPDLAGGVNNAINVGDNLVALTAVTSQSTTAGRVAPQDLSGATSVLGNQVGNQLGRALTARTTTNTALSILVDVGSW